MDTVISRGCGLDVHKRIVVACRRIVGPDGKVQSETRSFGTMTADLLALSDWLAEAGVTHVAMESTGVFWKPIWNMLAGPFEVLLVNAQHVKKVPGRKTDVKDCEWLAQLLQCGLLRPSFVPPLPLRELRDLTRHRAKLVKDKTAVANRIQKVLEDANIKLASVASDVLGVSGRQMLNAIVDGEGRPEVLAEMARKRLREKIPELRLALQGRVTPHHRFMLKTLLEHLAFLEAQIARIDERVEAAMRPFAQELELVDTIPGVDQRNAENLLAEIGTDMTQFPSADALASWAGICPGNNESAGKRKSGKTPKGNRWLRRTLTETAWAAAHTKNTYLSAKYQRLVRRRGKKRAIIAVAHDVLRAAYYVLTRRTSYNDLGSDYFDRMDPQRLQRYYVRRLNALGLSVTVTPVQEAAA